MFYFDEIEGKKVLKSDLIQKAQAFFTTRDICIKSKEEKMQEVVLANKKLIAKYLNITEEMLISPSQTHTANIEIAQKTKNTYPETDGLILTDKDMGIFLNFADCTPVILYDEKQNIGAVVHAGWRGTAQQIAPKAVEKLTAQFGSKPKNIVAVVGPAISFCCYNVGEEVLSQLSQTVKDFSDLSEVRGENIFVDLKNINRQQLKEIGVSKIDVCPYCTVCNNEYFYSYRKENATTNRHSAVLKLL